MSATKVFYLRDGKKFSSIKALAKELKNMSVEIYEHHVNPLKNDFHTWIKNSIKDEILAKRIDGHINKIQMELEILRHLINTTNKVKKTKKKLVKNKSKTNENKIIKIKPSIKKKEVVRISTKKKITTKNKISKSKSKK